MQNLLAFTMKRLLALIIVVWAITTITFFLAHLSPSDPIRAILGQKLASDPHEYYALRHLFGLDRPLGQQYVAYLGGLLHGNLGYSEEPNTLGRPVWELLKVGVPVSLTLGGYSLLLALLVGLPVGLISALKKN